jgi:hypothetical protein
MPIDIQAISRDHSTVTIHFGGDSAKVKYKLSAVTTEAIEKIDASDQDADEVIGFIRDVILEWDLLAGGETIPFEMEPMKKIPLGILQKTMKGILEDSGEGEGQGTSDDG